MSVKFEKIEIYEIGEIAQKLGIDETKLMLEMQNCEVLRIIDDRAFVSSENLKRFFTPKKLTSVYSRNI